MPFRLGSLLLLFACGSCLPLANGAERPGDVSSLYELERHANAVTALESKFLASIEAAPSEERFRLYWTYNHLTGSWFQVDYLQELLELSLEARSHSAEGSIRTALRD